MLRHVSTSATARRQVQVYWDKGCPLCTREINLMKRLDSHHRIEFIPVSSDTCPTNQKALLERFHAREDGVLCSGAAAFAVMWRQLPQPQLNWLGHRARNPAVLWVLERMYRSFLVVRPSLQWVVRKLTS